MDPVEHYFRLRENDKSHDDAMEHVRLRFGMQRETLAVLLDDYRAVVRQRLALLSGNITER